MVRRMPISCVSALPGVLEISPPAVVIHSPSSRLFFAKPIEVIRRDVCRLCGTQNSEPGVYVR